MKPNGKRAIRAILKQLLVLIISSYKWPDSVAHVCRGQTGRTFTLSVKASPLSFMVIKGAKLLLHNKGTIERRGKTAYVIVRVTQSHKIVRVPLEGQGTVLVQDWGGGATGLLLTLHIPSWQLKQFLWVTSC